MLTDDSDFPKHYPLDHYRALLEHHRRHGPGPADLSYVFENALWSWLRVQSAMQRLEPVPAAEGRGHPWADAWTRLIRGEPDAEDGMIVTAGMAQCLIDPIVKHREEAYLPIEQRYERLVQRVIAGKLPHKCGLKHGWAVDALSGERLRIDIEAWRPRLGAMRSVGRHIQFVYLA